MSTNEKKVLLAKMIIRLCKMPTIRSDLHVENNGNTITIQKDKVFANIRTDRKELKTLNQILEFAINSKIIEKDLIEEVNTIYS